MSNGKRVLLLGASGTIGRATCAELIARGHIVICVLRRQPGPDLAQALAGADVRVAPLDDPVRLSRDGIGSTTIDALVTCLSSRTGVPDDAWAVDHAANSHGLRLAMDAGATQVVLLSAICVQKPKLAFQRAKLAFEAEVVASGLDHAIVRPTAFFKSLSGQIARVKAGKPFLVFGDGKQTACKPISDRDLASYLADCLERPAEHAGILPIGGPGPAITPLDQAEALARLLGIEVKVRKVPLVLFDAISGVLRVLGRASPKFAQKAELARIGRYYASESMLVWDPAAGRYDADATPETGTDRLFDHFADVISGTVTVERGDHAVF